MKILNVIYLLTERSLKRSNINLLKQLSKDEIIDVIPVSEEVMKIKGIVPEVHPQ